MVNLTVGGVTYAYPTTGDEEWGDAASGWAQAVTANMLQKSGGLFTLTADVDFGANFGLKSVYFKTRAANPAGAGQFRLGNTESVSWRNAANNANLALLVNASNVLEFNGNQLLTSTGSLTASRAMVTDASSVITTSAVTATEQGYLSGVTSAIQTQLNAKAPAANPTFTGTITTPLTVDHVAIFGASGVLASEANLALTRGGTGAGTAAGARTNLDVSQAMENLTEETAISTADFLPFRDSSGGADRKMLLPNLFTAGLVPGFVYNLGVTYAAGVLTVCGADGSALSATNPGIVVLQSKANPGRLKFYRVTANQAFQDDAHASSEIITNLFGATTGIAWGDDCPFFIYAVGNDNEDTIAFMLSRDPRATVSPADTAIGAPDDPVADTETSFFSFDNLDETLYDANPCACIGAIRMRMSASDDWTVQTLSNKDGIGRFHESTKFTFPQNQNGAAVGTHLLANGGTPAAFSTESFFYWVGRDGKVKIEVEYASDAGTDGSGAVAVYLALPIQDRGCVAGQNSRLGYSESTGAGNVVTIFRSETSPTEKYRLFSTAGPFTHATFGNGGREISLATVYQGFTD